MMDTISLSEQVGEALRARGMFLVTAESCTGGLLGHLVTETPGSSEYYLGGFVSYAYAAKRAWLGVRQETLEKHGAVSEETVLEMAAGARAALGDEYERDKIIAAAISGVAGPGGGMVEKPVGTVWIALDGPPGAHAKRYQFSGFRSAIKGQSAEQALNDLLEYLQK